MNKHTRIRTLVSVRTFVTNLSVFVLFFMSTSCGDHAEIATASPPEWRIATSGKRTWVMQPDRVGVELCAPDGLCRIEMRTLPSTCGHIGDGIAALGVEVDPGPPLTTLSAQALALVAARCADRTADLSAALTAARATTGLAPAELLALAELWNDALLMPPGIAASSASCATLVTSIEQVAARVPRDPTTESTLDLGVADGVLFEVPGRLRALVEEIGVVGEPAGGLVRERGIAGFWMVTAAFLDAGTACGARNLLIAAADGPPDAVTHDTDGAIDVIEAALTQKPVLWMPFVAGSRHTCTQGYNGAISHRASYTKHALDLDTDNNADEVVVAALAGQVDYAYSGCIAGTTAASRQCGSGFGNHIKLFHGGAYFTVYGHLKSMSVGVGAKVGRAARLGIEGTTGNSTGDHLHFSQHEGPRDSTLQPTVSSQIRTRDVTNGGAFGLLDVTSFVCGIPGGHVYESDNSCTSGLDALGSARTIGIGAFEAESCAVGDVDYYTFNGRFGRFGARVTSSPQSIADCNCSILNQFGIELRTGGVEGYTRNISFNGTQGCECKLSNALGSRYYLKLTANMPGKHTVTASTGF